MSNAGWVINARAIASICCSPPESERAPALAQAGKRAVHLLELRARAGAGASGVGPELEVFLDRHLTEELAALGHHGDPTLHHDVGGQSAKILALPPNDSGSWPHES